MLRLALVILNTFIFCSSLLAAEADFQKGISFVAWEKERYASGYSDKSLQRLAQTGADYVAIITTHYQEQYNSKKIFPTEKTPSDTSLIHAINKAHEYGLKVMLKPHLDLLEQSGSLWRADIGFQTQADWQEWFSEYLKFILHYARLAEETDVDLFCIGTELSFASRQSKFWQEYIIPQVRKVYKGELIYAANWDEYKNIRFWGDLDYAGIDAYFPLTGAPDPKYEEIEKSWIKWADEIEQWQRNINKPVIFTEIGYRSCALAAAKPWDSFSSGKTDLEIQTNCYNAALKILSGRDWFKGVYWWYWKTYPYVDGLNNRDFTPQNKPAEEVLTQWYKRPSFAQILPVSF